MVEATCEVTVKGRVQGVCYRMWAKTEAVSLGLTGYVKNLPSRSVVAVLQGEKERVALMAERMNEGPPLARVDEINIQEKSFSEPFSSFEVRY